jgi:hypothetical protein
MARELVRRIDDRVVPPATPVSRTSVCAHAGDFSLSACPRRARGFAGAMAVPVVRVETPIPIRRSSADRERFRRTPVAMSRSPVPGAQVVTIRKRKLDFVAITAVT